jgi:hypothetical protein
MMTAQSSPGLHTQLIKLTQARALRAKFDLRRQAILANHAYYLMIKDGMPVSFA